MDEIRKNNNPANAMDTREEVKSNDRKMKQDFPGYPHNPASEDVMKEEKNWRTDFSNESDTTATGTESVRKGERPTAEENEVSSGQDSKDEEEIRRGSDRGLRKHEVDPDDPHSQG
jgi:hypothetical protein